MELPSYFTAYLQKIQPSRSSRELAIQLHKTLRARLGSSDDAVFQRWYTGDSFIYGSYIRNTALQPIKDVDICILLNHEVTEFTPEVVVRRLRRVLENLGYKDKVAYQHRSVRIDMSRTTLDVVPVVAVNGTEQPILIPDRKLKQWVETHPKGHIEKAKELNANSAKRYIPFVKIVKAWYRYQAKERRQIERPKPKGFTLEALVAQYQDADAPTYAEAFVNFLSNLVYNCGFAFDEGIFPDILDPGIPNQSLKLTFSEEEARLFGVIVRESLDQARIALGTENFSESAEAWRLIFGPQFPKAPETSKSAIDFEESLLDYTVEAELEDVNLLEIPKLQPLKLKVEISTSKDGKISQQYPSGSRALAKNMWLKFSIASTTVKAPYEIQWVVTNYGYEAREADDLGHLRVTSSDEPYIWEHTKYRGTHTMTCKILKSNFVVAQAVHKVSIR